MKVKNYWKSFDQIIFFSVFALIVFGLVAVSSASAVLSFQRFGNNNYYFFRQILFASVGMALLYITSRIDYHVWRKWSRLILVLGLLSLAAVLVPQVGFATGNTRSWFSIGRFLLQPSEFMKLAVIFYFASWFERKKGAETNFWFGILPPLLVLGVVISLVVLEPDLGTASVIALIAVSVLFAAGTAFRYLFALGGVGVAALWILIKAAPYRAARVVTFLDPSLDPRGIGYHINQALLAIGSGGFWGYGFGGSRQKHNYLPEPIGDSIFAVMAEELGFIRIVIIVLLFLVFAIAGIRLAKQAPDKFGQLTAIGVTAWVVFQAFMNIGAIIGIMPLTGITLPFISYGGSSLLALCLGIGVMLNISRQRV